MINRENRGIAAHIFVFVSTEPGGGNQVQFQMIDLRLVYIVLFSSLYGINYGLAAAGLETLSLLAAYTKTGIGWTTLFTNLRTGFRLSSIL